MSEPRYPLVTWEQTDKFDPNTWRCGYCKHGIERGGYILPLRHKDGELTLRIHNVCAKKLSELPGYFDAIGIKKKSQEQAKMTTQEKQKKKDLLPSLTWYNENIKKGWKSLRCSLCKLPFLRRETVVLANAKKGAAQLRAHSMCWDRIVKEGLNTEKYHVFGTEAGKFPNTWHETRAGSDVDPDNFL